jgi:hypothetical protein
MPVVRLFALLAALLELSVACSGVAAPKLTPEQSATAAVVQRMLDLLGAKQSDGDTVLLVKTTSAGKTNGDSNTGADYALGQVGQEEAFISFDWSFSDRLTSTMSSGHFDIKDLSVSRVSPDTLTATDRANGANWRGSISLNFAYRPSTSGSYQNAQQTYKVEQRNGKYAITTDFDTGSIKVPIGALGGKIREGLRNPSRLHVNWAGGQTSDFDFSGGVSICQSDNRNFNIYMKTANGSYLLMQWDGSWHGQGAYDLMQMGGAASSTIPNVSAQIRDYTVGNGLDSVNDGPGKVVVDSGDRSGTLDWGRAQGRWLCPPRLVDAAIPHYWLPNPGSPTDSFYS